MTARVLVLVALAACGDNLELEQAFAPTSGTRLKLEQYHYRDGTLQADTTTFYDIALHDTCTAQRWSDGELRCVPPGDEARFLDAECTTAAGIANEPVRRPTHFLGYDTVDTARRPARIYRVLGTTDAFTTYYLQRDGECLGPYSGPDGTDHYTLGALEPTDLIAFTNSELGAGRLGLQIRETPDGFHLPLGAYDRDLELPCTPALRADGVACEPTTAAAATAFRDAECTQPVIAVPALDEVPRAARTLDPLGCPRFHAIGDEVDPPLYRRDGGTCTRISTPLGNRVFELGAPLQLAQLDRTVEAVPDRRLQGIVLSPVGDPDLRFVADRLVDSATRDECVRVTAGDVSWCLPAVTAPSFTLFATGCSLPVQVVELPERTCGPITFASAPSGNDEALELFAIGDRVATPLYHFSGIGCVAYEPGPGRVLRALGPPLPADTFVRASKYGERNP